jgi:hypothetical protein
VLYLTLPTASSLVNLKAYSFVASHPTLVQEIGMHALAHTMYSYVRSGRNAGISRRLNRRRTNQKKRWFVDNIIMHHKRLHDRNREIAISNARQRAIERNKKKNKENLDLEISKLNNSPNKNIWRQKIAMQERSKQIRGRIDARRTRARSRWLTISSDKKNS